jgi:hypothetical protein
MAKWFTTPAWIVGTTLLTGCINIFAAYEDTPPSTRRHDPHEPRSLARTLLQVPSLPAYSDDGQHFGVHLCKAWRDDSVTCELGFGDRAGLNELWPVLVPARSLDSDGARAVVTVLAKRLRKLKAHLMEESHDGPIAGVSAAKGEHRVTFVGDLVRLGHVTGPGAAEQLLAAARIEGGRSPTRMVVHGSYRRRDAVAVELWHDAPPGPVARYNDWVLFFREPDGRWRSTQVRGLDDSGPRIYPAAIDAQPTPGVGVPVVAPVQATPVTPTASPAASSAAIAR